MLIFYTVCILSNAYEFTSMRLLTQPLVEIRYVSVEKNPMNFGRLKQN